MKFTKTMLILFILLVGLVMIMPVSAGAPVPSGNIQIAQNINAYTASSNDQDISATMDGAYGGYQETTNSNTYTIGCNIQSIKAQMGGINNIQTASNINTYTKGIININKQQIDATIKGGFSGYQESTNLYTYPTGFFNYNDQKIKVKMENWHPF